jgi:hypothetical protein
VIIWHEVGVLRLRRVLIPLLIFVAIGLWLSCGGSTPSGGAHTSGLKYRAFISDSVSAGTSSAGVYIVDAQNDQRPVLSPIAAGNNPGMMVVTPNLAQTLVFSGTGTQTSDNQLSFINNTSEQTSGHVNLPGMTESIVVSPDSNTAYVAIPTAPVVGQSPGVVEVIALGTGNFNGEVNVPAVHYLSIDNSGNRILGFSDHSDSVTVITPSNIGIPNTVVTTIVGGFDRPVAAFFSSDDNTAYVLNCGAECSGQQAGIQKLDLTSNTLAGNSVGLCTTGTTPQCAGSVGLVNGSTLYVAGTPYSVGGGPSLPCPSGTQAQYCGLLTAFDLGTMSIINTAPIITDGYHNRMAMGANGQLFIGARTCTEITTVSETRGCLSIYNTLNTAVGANPAGGVLVAPENGDATGIQPIGTRQVVYVVQGGSLFIYDATTDALLETQITNVVGQFIDVKTVDF